jgi:hypothetical protein
MLSVAAKVLTGTVSVVAVAGTEKPVTVGGVVSTIALLTVTALEEDDPTFPAAS